MQQIADWLEKLGMSEYAERFAENRIDLSVLPDLTDQHLKDLGIALGDRLKMLRAIRQLADAIPASPRPALTEPKSQDNVERRQQAPVPAAATPPSISVAVEPTGERRHVTVMFCDLVDSTGIASPYSITSSATVSNLSGIVRPSALAVLRLITSSYSVGCSMGSSPGLAPLSILSTKAVERRVISVMLGP